MMVILPMMLLSILVYVVFIIALAIPICIGSLIQVLLILFVRHRWLHLISVVLGMIGLAVSLLFLQSSFSVYMILIYWAVYFFVVCMIWLLFDQIKKRLFKKEKRQETADQ